MGEFEIGGLQFDWDDEKYQINFKKHKVRFAQLEFYILLGH